MIGGRMERYGMIIALFGAVLTGSYGLISYIQEKSLVSYMGQQVLEKATKSERARIEREKERRRLEGNRRKNGWLYHMDVLLLHSGVKSRLKFLNTELFLTFLLFLAAVAELVLGAVKASVLWKVFGPVIMVAFVPGILQLLSLRACKKAEQQLLPFMNLIGNYSRSCDDLVSIFGRIYPYLEEPLKGAVEDCYLYARTTGNLSAAFYELGLKIPHEQFQKFIRNLEICYRHEANYEYIIDDSREMLQDYLRNKREREAMRNNARIEVLMIILSCLFAFYMMDNFMEQSLLELLKNTLPGKLLSGYCIAVLLACVKLLLWADR